MRTNSELKGYLLLLGLGVFVVAFFHYTLDHPGKLPKAEATTLQKRGL